MGWTCSMDGTDKKKWVQIEARKFRVKLPVGMLVRQKYKLWIKLGLFELEASKL
jgi:hypothetical protein